MSQPTDHVNLLFGIIAHQMDFVDQGALIKAMNTWAFQKNLPLAEILVDNGDLQEDTRALIDALVSKHLESHGKDPRNSLGAVTTPSEVSALLSQLPDDGVREQLQDIKSLFPNPTLPAPLNQAEDQCRFRIVRHHASGGIGVVHVAEDQELSREVALKELRVENAYNADARSRFLVEGEITGQLEHPGIVPVYDRGKHPDGRPFFAMRFIHGKSLEREIKRFHARTKTSPTPTDTDFHRLLHRFVEVCNAVEYAHSRGVVHRDLKPDNIMLGDFGETLVVDWGLAKVGPTPQERGPERQSGVKIKPDSLGAETHAGSVFGTPAYMSPEQTEGNQEAVGPKSDIYSLGATLYQLLTGKRPITGDSLSKIFERIKAGDVATVRSLAPETPRALEAICRRAMEVDPDDRYPSVAAMAEDIENWLADQPVSVVEESFGERAWRWVRHHRTTVASVSLAAGVALVCLMIGMLLLNASRQRERQARQQAENAFALAEERFRETRGVVDRFYTQVSEEVLLRQPGLQQVRRELLEMTLAHYQRFVEQRSDDRDLLQEAALTWYRIGSITEELQSPENSLEAYKRAEEIQRQISGSKDAAGIGALLSDTVNAIGRVEQKRGDLEAAGVAYQEATRLRQEAVTLRPDQTGLQRKLANSIMNSGLVLHLSGDERAGLELIKRAQERRWNQLASSDDVKLRRDLGMGEYNLAILVMADDPDAGEQHLLSAVDAFDRVLEKTPRDSMTEKNLASSHRLLADRYLALGRIKDAITHYRAAVSILETLTIRNPESVDFQVALASVQMNMAATDVSEGRTADAIARLESSIGLLDRLADSISSVPMYRRDLAAACNKLASLVEETDPERARAYRERALEILTHLNREYPENGLFQNDLESALEGSTNAF